MKIAIYPGRLKLYPGIEHTPNSISAIAYNICEGLVKRGHEVTLYATSDSITGAKLPPGVLPSSHPLIKNQTKKNLKKASRLYYEMIARDSGKYDIIHNHWKMFLFYANQISTPTATTLHMNRFGPRYRGLYLKNIIAISNSQKKVIPAINFIEVIPNGINLRDFPYCPKPKNYLLWLGRVHKYKGALEAIKVAVNSKTKLICAGNLDKYDKPYVAQFKRALKKHKRWVDYAGEVGHQEKVKLLKNASATLMPIQWDEPFGLVAAESMACGTPVIALNKGGLPEIIKHGETGFIAGNAEEMGEFLKKIKSIKRAACRSRVAELFSLDRMVDDYEKLFQKIIKPKK